MQIKNFNELSNSELYQILRLRSEVFVVEQKCIFQDIDSLDQISKHFFIKEDNEIISYLRTYKKGTYNYIGRVCTNKLNRNKGLSKKLINKAIENIDKPIKIYAQYYLQYFYESFNFKQTSEVFLEDGIEHIEMVLN